MLLWSGVREKSSVQKKSLLVSRLKANFQYLIIGARGVLHTQFLAIPYTIETYSCTVPHATAVCPIFVEYKVHSYSRNGLVVVAFMDDHYPVRSAFSLLNKVPILHTYLYLA
jgi:hypothetical protein